MIKVALIILGIAVLIGFYIMLYAVIKMSAECEKAAFKCLPDSVLDTLFDDVVMKAADTEDKK